MATTEIHPITSTLGLFGEGLSLVFNIFGSGDGQFDGHIVMWILGIVGAIIGFLIGNSSDAEEKRKKAQKANPPITLAFVIPMARE